MGGPIVTFLAANPKAADGLERLHTDIKAILKRENKVETATIVLDTNVKKELDNRHKKMH